MKYVLTLLPMLAAIGARPAMGAPSSLVPRQEDWDGEQTGGIFCERRLQPNWADCSTIMGGSTYFGEGDPNFSVCVDANMCRIWSEGNCRISFCNNEGYQVCDPASIWGGRARDIESNCKSSDSGGYQSKPPPQDWSEVAIRLNTNWRLMSKSDSGEIEYREMSVEENEAELRALYEDIDSVAAVSAASALESRQADRFSDVVIRANVHKPGSAVWVGQVVNDGDYTVSTAESKTFSISASASLGASAWDAVSAEIGVSASYSTTMTNTVSVTINIQCSGGYGQIYWRPFFDEYEGTLASDGRRVRIWVPKDTDQSRMNYDYQCTG